MLDEIRRSGHRCDTPLEERPDGIFVLTPERPYGPIRPAFFDVDQRFAFLDKLGIGQQVLIPPPFVFYYWTNDGAARDLMALENDSLATTVSRYPTRFQAFGTVMMQDVPAAVRECERIKNLGLRGVEIGSNVNGASLDELRFWPFYEAMEALDLAILIHPADVTGKERMADYHLRNLVGFPFDTTLAAAKLIFSGVLERFPRLRICLGQAGGFLPWIIGRLDAGFRARPECRRNIVRPPSDYLRQFYYDTIIHSPASSHFLIEVVGSNRVMLGTDFPFDMGAASPVAEIENQSTLSDEQRADVFYGTAARFLGLSAAQGAARGAA
ncbi:MAG: amidohydrolase [Alphaproteobacteria bacterium]|nr:amidohydrolase [Alphaproteobacteria bacterium]